MEIISMEQLEIDFQTTGIDNKLAEYINKYSASNTVFSPVHIYDKASGKDTYAIQYAENWTDAQIRLNIIIVPEHTFAVSGYLYLDTVFKDPNVDPIKNARVSYSEGGTLDIVCYMNFSSETKVVDIHKNLKTILNAFYISSSDSNSFKRIPMPSDRLPDWVSFNPAVGMYVIKSDFVLHVEEDYSGVGTCFYRSGPAAKSASILYKYANGASTSICSNEYLEAIASKEGLICQCPHYQASAIRNCSFYKEDRISPFKTELYSIHNQTAPVATIDCYIIREILSEGYSIVFEKTDLLTGKTTILKKLSYENASDQLYAEPDNFISEALLQNNLVLCDYALDYTNNVINHIQSFVELKKKPESNVKSSYLSRLVS